MLLFSPLWLFFIPGATLFLLGAAASTWLATGFRSVGAVELDVHSLLVTATLAVVGFQLMAFAAFAKGYAVAQGLHPPHRLLDWFQRPLRLELGVGLGLLLASIGAVALAHLALDWQGLAFGHLAVRRTMRMAIPATLCLAVGVQTVFSSFFLGILGFTSKAPASTAAPPVSSSS